MEAAEEDVLASCLLQWVRSFKGVGEIATLSELIDARALWSILQDIDQDHFVEDLPEPAVNATSDWTRKWQNLKHLEKHVSMYYRDVCNGQDRIDAEAVPDLKAIAMGSSVPDLEKLIMIIIRASMASPELNQRMAQRLMSLGRDNAMIIANELRNLEEADVTESEPVSRDESADQSEQELDEEPTLNGFSTVDGKLYQDPLLEREEQLLQAQATIDKLQASHSQAQRQMQELRQEKERLQEAFDSYRDETDAKGRKVGGDDTFKKLQRQTESDRAYIDDLEHQLQSSRGAIEDYERQVQRHKDDSDHSQQLRDDLQMLKADNEDLNQKLRANENLKKKIQTLQEAEKSNATLREEVKQANERLEDLTRLKQVQAGLEKEIIEKQGLIRNQEYQINELTTTRKHAEYDARVLAQKLQDARERHDRDHEAMQELRVKLQDTSLEDVHEDDEQEEAQAAKVAEPTDQHAARSNDESKHLAEKLALLEKQLEAADIRLKQATERNTAMEEQQRSSEADSEGRQQAESRIEQHERTIANLQKELEAASAASKQKSVEPASARDMAALERENHLMATAWYDLSSRLQNNGVSLARRRQEPKSWIGKQRALVGPNAGLQR